MELQLGWGTLPDSVEATPEGGGMEHIEDLLWRNLPSEFLLLSNSPSLSFTHFYYVVSSSPDTW